MKTEVRGSVVKEILEKKYPYIAKLSSGTFVVVFTAKNYGVILQSPFPPRWTIGSATTIEESNYIPLGPTEEFVMRND